MSRRIEKQIAVAAKAERPKAAKAHDVRLATAMNRRFDKQIVAAAKAERPKAAKAQVVGVGPHDN
jgi:hypothetical protein